MDIRKAVFAGSWYPAGAGECEREIGNFLKQEDIRSVSGQKVLGGIVPHAGWHFSGAIACHVIRSLADESPPDVILVLGRHLHPDSPNYIMAEGMWETPFGALEIENRITDELIKRFPFQIETAQRFGQDNTIELQLPFVKYFFKDVKIVPIGIPPAESALEIGKVAVDISTQLGLRMKVIGSTDLTHYGANYGFTPQGTGAKALEWMRDENDRRVINAMLAMDPLKVIREGLSHHNACCAGAAATAIAAGKQLGAQKAESLAYATSHDKHPSDSFVGYVGIVMLGA